MAAQLTGFLAVAGCTHRFHPSMIQSVTDRLLCMVELRGAALLHRIYIGLGGVELNSTYA